MTSEEYEEMIRSSDEKEVLGIDVGVEILERLIRIEEHLGIKKKENNARSLK